MYSTAFWCLIVVYCFFLALLLDQSQQECRFFRRNSNPLQTFELQPKRETSPFSLGDRLEKRSIISPSNRAIWAGLRGTSGFRPVPVTTVALTN